MCLFFNTSKIGPFVWNMETHYLYPKYIFTKHQQHQGVSGRLGVKSNYRSKSDWVWRLVMQLCREISTKDFSLLSNCYSMSLSSSRDLKPAIIIMSPSAVRWCERNKIDICKIILPKWCCSCGGGKSRQIIAQIQIGWIFRRFPNRVDPPCIFFDNFFKVPRGPGSLKGLVIL